MDQHESHLTARCTDDVRVLILASTVCYGCKENRSGEPNEGL